MRFLAFDCLVVDDQNVMSRPLDKRYGVCGLYACEVRNETDMGMQRLQEWFYKPYSKMLKDHPHMAQAQPFG